MMYPLPYVDHVKHLECTLQTDNSFTRDINQKRGHFIVKIHPLNQKFYFAESSVLIKYITFMQRVFMEPIF